ncbi:putative maltase-glucoamylase 2 [Bagarius yarrelli]|uniref:Maltase n=1 Tax=Bagarius yarrelli TaxID=175774 RepID=A0A556V1X6_BAGYA|nr:putative maltase-glucoamylase 2 [Bagarius yarrelli]
MSLLRSFCIDLWMQNILEQKDEALLFEQTKEIALENPKREHRNKPTGNSSHSRAVSINNTDFVAQCPVIPLAERVDCFPDAGASQQSCQARGCCWGPHDQQHVPWCFFSKNHGYTVVSEKQLSSTKSEARLKKQDSPSLFGSDIPELSFIAEMQTENRLHFKITDANKARFEVPHEHIQSLSSSVNGPLKYQFELLKSPFGVRVLRVSNKKVLFDTSIGPLVFADQYLQISAKLPSSNIYGLGEHVHQQFRHDLNWRTWPIFTRDAFPNGGTHNLYGHYPFFMCLEDESGKSFGVFLMNSNAMEVTLQPAPAVTYRTIGGVLDFYILLGETPEDIVQEFTQLVGRPTIPPYWALGFQLSRWDYGSLDEVKRTVERNRAIDLPYDVQYTDIDYMEDKKDFTYDMVRFRDLPEFADYMHAHGQKYILILDPAIATSKRINGTYESYDRGTQAEAWITEADGNTPLFGEVWPGETVFPDYTKQSCIKWWVEEIQQFHKQVKHDALWIDMNEVASFVPGSSKGCADNTLNYPPFTPKILDNLMYSKTLCMDAKQAWGNHYDVHSLYGYSMVLATEEASRQVFGSNRSFILTRSSFPGVGKYSGHWLGDNAATWNDIKWAITGMLEFNLFGVPYIGADICGFFDNVDEELCTRWMQVGAFYPFSRNHNAQHYRPQDPAAFGADSLLVKSSKHYLTIRYKLLPYLYTLFYRAYISGDTVGKDTVEAYIPDAVWYNYETELKIKERKQLVNMYLPLDKMGLHIRGGAILPIQRPAVTTVYSRRSAMGLIIALDDNNQASGELFWDDGESRDTISSGAYIHYQFSVVQGVLTMQVIHNGYADPNNLVFENITVLGLISPPMTVSIKDGNMVTTLPESNIQYDSVKRVLQLRNLQLQLGKSYTLTWSSTVEELQRFDCYPDEMATEESCIIRGCIWEPSTLNGVPWCYFPMDYGYIADPAEETGGGLRFTIKRNNKYPVPRALSRNIDTLQVEITYLSGHSLRFKIFDPANKRYEVPVPLDLPPMPEEQENMRMYTVNITRQPFGIQYKMNCYGVHPFYMGLEPSAHAYGVLLLNSNAMDVTVQPTPALTYRTIGGILDFYMVMGPTPELVVQEYTAMIGRPVLPAYWSLGFQLCRYGYANDAEIEALYHDMLSASIPYDVQYADIDYMERQLDFVLDKDFVNLPNLVRKMKGEGMRFIFILDPAISGNETNYPAFDRGVENDVFIKWPAELSDGIVWGKVWPDLPNVTVDESLDWDTQVKIYRAYTAFPDFFRNRTADWWQKEISDFYANLTFDGLWIDMNEPVSFVDGTVDGKCLGPSIYDHPPYMPRMMEFSLFGISYTGADICGFFNQAEYEMCLRWMQLGAFYPYSRNHNGKGNPRQDPVAWDAEFAEASRHVLNIRYTLLPYLYTLMFEAHTKGSTVVRPLLHEFVDDKVTWDIDKQFMWGPALLITPALEKGVTEVIGYIPNARWYDYHTAKLVNVRGNFFTMPTPLNHINLHVRGGHILPWQKPENNTQYSRKNPLGLIVALDDHGTASGSLFWDDGEGIDTYANNAYFLTYFSVIRNNLANLVIHNGVAPVDQLKLGQVKVWGAGGVPITKVTMRTGGTDTALEFVHNVVTEAPVISLILLVPNAKR